MKLFKIKPCKCGRHVSELIVSYLARLNYKPLADAAKSTKTKRKSKIQTCGKPKKVRTEQPSQTKDPPTHTSPPSPMTMMPLSSRPAYLSPLL